MGMPCAAKAGNAILAGCSMLISEAPWPGNAQGSVSVHDSEQSQGFCVLLHTAKVHSAAEGPCCALQQQQQLEEPLNPSASTASTWGFHPQQGRDSCAQPAHPLWHTSHLPAANPDSTQWPFSQLSTWNSYKPTNHQHSDYKALHSPLPSVFVSPNVQCSHFHQAAFQT